MGPERVRRPTFDLGGMYSLHGSMAEGWWTPTGLYIGACSHRGVGIETAAGRYVWQAVRYGSSQAEGGVAARYRDSMGRVGGTWILAMSSVRVAPRSYAWWPGAPGGAAARSPVAALGTVAAVGMYRNDAAVSSGWHLEGSGKVAAGSQNGLLQRIQLPLQGK